jgi:hypothetical protein
MYPTLGFIDPQLQPFSEVVAYTRHDSLARPLGFHVDIAIVRVAAESMTTAFQFLVQVIQQDIGE